MRFQTSKNLFYVSDTNASQWIPKLFRIFPTGVLRCALFKFILHFILQPKEGPIESICVSFFYIRK